MTAVEMAGDEQEALAAVFLGRYTVGTVEVFHAARLGYNYVVQYFARNSHGIDINWRNPNMGDNTALHAAAFGHRAAVIDALLRFPGIDPNVENRDGQKAVDCVSTQSHTNELQRAWCVALFALEANVAASSAGATSVSRTSAASTSGNVVTAETPRWLWMENGRARLFDQSVANDIERHYSGYGLSMRRPEFRIDFVLMTVHWQRLDYECSIVRFAATRTRDHRSTTTEVRCQQLSCQQLAVASGLCHAHFACRLGSRRAPVTTNFSIDVEHYPTFYSSSPAWDFEGAVEVVEVERYADFVSDIRDDFDAV